ncbi:MAG: cytochrome c3 family protein [Nitrospirota bacterium]
MRIKTLSLIALLLLSSGLSAEESPRVITLNYPPDKTVMEYDVLSISLNVPAGSSDSIKIAVNDREGPAIVPDRETECLSVLLKTGVNRISIKAETGGTAVDNITIDVFRRSDLESAYKQPPPGFRKDYFHMKDRQQCGPCHVLRPAVADKKPVSIAAFPSERQEYGDTPAGSTCYSCHKRLTAYPFVHGPSAVWSCLSCHDPVAAPIYSVRKPDTKVCFGCHIEQKAEWERRKYFHGPYTTGSCTICHSPHASENPSNLHKPIWDLCINCHTDKGSGSHIVAAVGGLYFHPTRGKRDPLRKDRELSCVSCHDPHASDSPRLWRLNVGSGFELCRKCHTE